MKCYVTIVTTEDYFPGVKILKDSLVNVNSKYQLRIFVPEKLYDNLLSTGYYGEDELVKYHFDVSLDEEIRELNSSSQNSQWNYTFDKLILFSRTEYEKMVYLDCDMEVKKNIDELFDRPHMAAVNPSVGNSDYTRGFNSGLMVIVPESNLHIRILNCLKDKNLNNLTSISDNDLLQLYYNDWDQNLERVLPDEYNVYYPYIEQYMELKEIKVVHYIGKIKPWMME